jgi:hypothetical protein
MISESVGRWAVRQVSQLSAKLKKKEHQLEMAEHKIEMLVRSVRDLEAHMSR